MTPAEKIQKELVTRTLNDSMAILQYCVSHYLSLSWKFQKNNSTGRQIEFRLPSQTDTDPIFVMTDGLLLINMDEAAARGIIGSDISTDLADKIKDVFGVDPNNL